MFAILLTAAGIFVAWIALCMIAIDDHAAQIARTNRGIH